MKFVIQWTARPGMTIADAETSLRAFGKWAPDGSVNFREFVARADGAGGFAVVETENATALLRDASLFGMWFEFTAYPVVDMLEAAGIQQETVELLTAL